MIFLDLETTSLNPEIGIIACIGVFLPDGERKFFFSEKGREKNTIREFAKILKKFRGEKIVIWYSNFDIPFLVTRAIKHNIDISEIYDFEIIDLCKLVRENLRLTSNKLEDVARFLGIEKNVKISGKMVHQLYLEALKGNKEARKKIILHCEDDLRAMEEVFKKLKPYVEKWLTI